MSWKTLGHFNQMVVQIASNVDLPFENSSLRNLSFVFSDHGSVFSSSKTRSAANWRLIGWPRLPGWLCQHGRQSAANFQLIGHKLAQPAPNRLPLGCLFAISSTLSGHKLARPASDWLPLGCQFAINLKLISHKLAWPATE